MPAAEVVGPPVLISVIVSVLEGQGALSIVHINTLVPVPTPVMVVVGEVGVVIVPVPLISVHVPVPTVGEFPAIVKLVLQLTCVGPAFEVVGAAIPVIVTVDVEGVQGGFEIVHSKTFGPTPNPVTPDVGEVGVVIVPVPLTNVHNPVPTVGVLPANVAVVAQTLCGGPAIEVVGPPVFVSVTVLVEFGQGGFEIVHINTFAPAPTDVIVVVADPGVVIVPDPLTNVHVPVPDVGLFPAIVNVVLHSVWLGPAAAVVGATTPVIVTVDVVEGQGAFAIVHINTFAPTPNPVTPEVGEEGVVMVPAPLTSVHVPVPIVAVLPANVAVVPQTVCGGPAAAVVGAATPVIVTVDVDGVQGAFAIVH
jgi:hypothetical protein